MITWHNISIPKGALIKNPQYKYMMIQFKNSTTKTLFKKTASELDNAQQAKFISEVKKIADKKIVSDSDDFTVNVSDLKVAIAKI